MILLNSYLFKDSVKTEVSVVSQLSNSSIKKKFGEGAQCTIIHITTLNKDNEKIGWFSVDIYSVHDVVNILSDRVNVMSAVYEPSIISLDNEDKSELITMVLCAGCSL
jgi:hypothetical protein